VVTISLPHGALSLSYRIAYFAPYRLLSQRPPAQAEKREIPSKRELLHICSAAPATMAIHFHSFWHHIRIFGPPSITTDIVFRW
jgi:hypothetical protein